MSSGCSGKLGENFKIPVASSEDADVKETGREPVEVLFAALESPLLAYAGKLVRNNGSAQDIVQEAFVRLHANFDAIRQPRAWLYRLVHNLALNHNRANRKIVPFESQPGGQVAKEPADELPRPDEALARLEAITRMRQSLKTLDERGRELIQLKFDEGLSYKEISRKTGLGIGNVGYLLHHALKHLASELKKTGIGP